MKALRQTTLLEIALLMTSCSYEYNVTVKPQAAHHERDSYTPPAAMQTAPANAIDSKLLRDRCPSGSVAVIGDSITVGFNGRNNYPDMLEDKLRPACPGIKVQHEDGNPNTLQRPRGNAPLDKYAFGGKSTPRMRRDFDTVLVGGHSDVIIMGGVNDLAGGRTAEDIKKDLADMYARAKQRGLRVIALTTTPCGWSEKTYAQQDALNKWIMSRPEGIDVAVDVFAALNDPRNPRFMKPEAKSFDRIHPGIAGLHMIADAIVSSAYSQLPTYSKSPTTAGSSEQATPGSFFYLR
ncbi:hypothetical protein HY772_05160 [Candidatus Woesearchaeota archaeon]|nr:hypothetical protein [Candidatus Woesearchaeota archaeon]